MTFRLLFLLALSACPVAAKTTAAPAPAPASTNTAPVAPVPPPNPYPLAITPENIIAKSEALLKQYKAPAVPAATDPVEVEVKTEWAAKKPEFQTFFDQVSGTLAKNPSLDRITSLQTLANDFSGYPYKWTHALEAQKKDVSKRKDQIKSDTETWSETSKALPSATPPAPPDITQRVKAALARLDLVGKANEAHLLSLLDLESQLTDLSTQISNAQNDLKAGRDQAVDRLFQRNAKPVWSGPLAAQPANANAPTWSKQVDNLGDYIAAEPGRFVVHGILLALLAAAFYWLRGVARKWCAEEPGIKFASSIFETPLATAILLSLIASPMLYYPITPRLLSAILGAVALAPSVIILRRLIEPRLLPILYALVAFFFLEEFRSVEVLPPGYGRVFFLAEMLAALLFLVWLLLSLHKAHPTSPIKRFGKWVRFAACVALFIITIGWAANALGYILLANLLCELVQRSATLALILYAAIRIVGALLFIMTRLRPLSTLGMVRTHGPLLLDRTGRVLIWIACLVWILYTLELLSLRDPVVGWIRNFLSTYDADKHQLHLTLIGKLLAAVAIGWGACQLSQFGRFVLHTDLYPRMHLSPGIPYAISTSLHYAVLVVAFVAATFVLGIDMTKFTILVSALGVGVGFGLQTIINNFVSGLILLFERPVKIGDSIQAGDATGVVERIGIRASVIRTMNGSEMIVPNANLISNSVTNWTLSSQERIIQIPFNVVRGPDVAHLMDLFTTTAAAHPKVLKSPPPQVLVLTLGANMGFEVRAWTHEIDSWSVVRSELLMAINAALVRENITLA